MFVKERRPISGYEEIYDKLIAKKEGIEEEIRKRMKDECEKVDAVIAEVTEEVDVEYPDPVPASTEDFDERAETTEPLY